MFGFLVHHLPHLPQYRKFHVSSPSCCTFLFLQKYTTFKHCWACFFSLLHHMNDIHLTETELICCFSPTESEKPTLWWKHTNARHWSHGFIERFPLEHLWNVKPLQSLRFLKFHWVPVVGFHLHGRLWWKKLQTHRQHCGQDSFQSDCRVRTPGESRSLSGALPGAGDILPPQGGEVALFAGGRKGFCPGASR